MIRMPHAPTHLGRILVAAMRDTLEMEGLAPVSCVTTMFDILHCLAMYTFCVRKEYQML